MSKATRIIFIIGSILLVYGYLCRLLNIYFFWDSKSFGWVIMAIGLMGYLLDVNRSKRIQGKRTFWVKMGIGIIIIGFVLGCVVIFMFKYSSKPYQVAIEYLKSDSLIKKEIGNVNGFGLIPTGSQTTVAANGNEFGKAVFFITVIGDKKYKDVEINLEKTPETVWTVYLVK